MQLARDQEACATVARDISRYEARAVALLEADRIAALDESPTPSDATLDAVLTRVQLNLALAEALGAADSQLIPLRARVDARVRRWLRWSTSSSTRPIGTTAPAISAIAISGRNRACAETTCRSRPDAESTSSCAATAQAPSTSAASSRREERSLRDPRRMVRTMRPLTPTPTNSSSTAKTSGSRRQNRPGSAPIDQTTETCSTTNASVTTRSTGTARPRAGRGRNSGWA